MGHAITVDVPQAAYESLAKTARQTGQTLEELAALWLATMTRQAADDPLEKFIGAITTNVSNWADMKNFGDDELAEEYDLASLPIMPKGRYAPERRLRKNLVVLDADLVQAFPNDEAVNKALRLVVQIAHIPQTTATP